MDHRNREAKAADGLSQTDNATASSASEPAVVCSAAADQQPRPIIPEIASAISNPPDVGIQPIAPITSAAASSILIDDNAGRNPQPATPALSCPASHAVTTPCKEFNSPPTASPGPLPPLKNHAGLQLQPLGRIGPPIPLPPPEHSIEGPRKFKTLPPTTPPSDAARP